LCYRVSVAVPPTRRRTSLWYRRLHVSPQAINKGGVPVVTDAWEASAGAQCKVCGDVLASLFPRANLTTTAVSPLSVQRTANDCIKRYKEAMDPDGGVLTLPLEDGVRAR
jgi:hypothetical protein